MATMTLTARSYADLKPVETFAWQRERASGAVKDADNRKRTAALNAFEELAAESRTAAIKAGYVTEDQVNALIEECMEEVRKEAGEVKSWGKNAHRD